ncbi:allantoin racemase [Marinobacter nanhaiticus D15-8W]|uniref:Asp/Glu/hydantoin racemase n=1 Tax=Marinobacter nanhaiticus D15-8W TaxID=626887 RepID=N6WPI2_9GAMM|nr:aspartate/glutamate racemase family protein [Marinobacter nanhaiticus]ENO12977.1 Asp/Glu/hydantoin racemase [Marinobacter nanhaiticus D15-8W]BES70330.1 allantoin racemase [Marinobacter nanhaiticus D15-8W]
MKLRVINPNDSETMRQMIEQTCLDVVAADTELDVVCGGAGVESVEGFYDGARAQVGVLDRVIEGDRGRCAGYLIACADDTGLHAAREIAPGPVIGIGEAAMHAATLLGSGFSILTAQQKSVPILEQNAFSYGFGRHARGVHAARLPVLALSDTSNTVQQELLIERAKTILIEDASEVLVLGCAGFAPYRKAMERILGVPVVDGVRVGILFLEAFVRGGLKTSKRNGYSPGIST